MDKYTRLMLKDKFELCYSTYIDLIDELKVALDEDRLSHESKELALYHLSEAQKNIRYCLNEFREG